MLFLRNTSGSVAPLFGLTLVAVLGVTAMAVDYSRGLNEQSKLQQALDASVLAGASSISDKIEAAEVYFDANVSSDIASGASANFTLDPSGRLSGTASAKVQNLLAGLLGHESTQIAVISEAIFGEEGNVCVLLLDPGASQALLVNGGADVSAPDCEFHSKSTGSNAAVFNGGTTLDTMRTCIESGSILDNGGNHPNLEVNCRTAGDPFAGVLPVPSAGTCDFNNQTYNGPNVVLSPGVYCGWTNFNGGVATVTLNPGLYVVKGGGWNANGGDWAGNGVTFYFDDTSMLQFNSNVKVNITAPSSGTYEDIVMFEKPGLAVSNMPVNDARGFDMRGLVYLPSRNLMFNGGSQMHAKEMAIVANTLILNQTKWTLTPGNYSFGGSAATDVVLVK